MNATSQSFGIKKKKKVKKVKAKKETTRAAGGAPVTIGPICPKCGARLWKVYKVKKKEAHWERHRLCRNCEYKIITREYINAIESDA